jgi:hypothetical protein
MMGWGIRLPLFSTVGVNRVFVCLWLAAACFLTQPMPVAGADASSSPEQVEKARKELKTLLDEFIRWDKKEPRPGDWIDKLPSVPPPFKRIEPQLDTVKLYNDASLLDQHWTEFLKRYPLTAKQLEASGIKSMPRYGKMPKDDFPAFSKQLELDLANVFENTTWYPKSRTMALNFFVWTAVYSDLLASRGDEKASADAGELTRLLAKSLFQFQCSTLQKDMPIVPYLAFELIYPTLTLYRSKDAKKKDELVDSLVKAFQIGYNLRLPAPSQYDWEKLQLAFGRWRLNVRVSSRDVEFAAAGLGRAYTKSKDYGKAIQYYHLATIANSKSERDYAALIKALLEQKYPKGQGEQYYLTYLKLLSRSELASMGGNVVILRIRADECKKNGQWEQAITLLDAMDPHRSYPETNKEITDLEEKLKPKKPNTSNSKNKGAQDK